MCMVAAEGAVFPILLLRLLPQRAGVAVAQGDAMKSTPQPSLLTAVTPFGSRAAPITASFRGVTLCPSS